MGALDAVRVHQVAVGQSHVLAIVGDGMLASWGSNEFGQLGAQLLNSLVFIILHCAIDLSWETFFSS